MPRKSKQNLRSNPFPFSLRTVSPNGTAPESRFTSADQVFQAARELVSNDEKRSKKRSRIFKAFNRFPPTEYSTLVELKMEGQSNVNWGMMAFIINNNVGSFYDMVAERPRACDIITKFGKDKIKQREWSDLISDGYDQYGLREDPEYLLNVEMDILDMKLYGKGIEFYDKMEGFQSDHCPADTIYVPEGTKINFSKWDAFMRKRSYSLNELYKAIKNKKEAEEVGWNIDAVVFAMRSCREEWRTSRQTNEEFLNEIARGSTSLSSIFKERVHVYDFYVLEYDDTISRMMVLQSYTEITSLVNEKSENPISEEDAASSQGFLFMKMKYAKSIRELMNVFIDTAGLGDWHNTPSLAEEVFVQCRQYDIVMNSIMDAIKMNMCLLLQGQTEEATQRLREVVWGQYAILPAGTPFVQQRVQLDTSSATQSLQYMMSDLYSGIGHYRVQEKTPSGEAPTATQRQLDAAESAKLKGTQISRFNESQTVFHRQRYERFIRLTQGEAGFELFEKFREEMRDNGVPDEAWKMKNIRSISSNMIAGSGSPSYKIMASEKIIALTNLVPKDDGQRAAIEDAIAALAFRANVRRYMPEKKEPDPTWEDRKLGLECEAFENIMMNAENVRVFPNDNHVKEVPYHLNDMAITVTKIEQAIQSGKIDEKVAMPAIVRLGNEGGHVAAHLRFIAGDKSKIPLMKEYSANLNVLQKAIGKIQQNLAKIMEEKKKPGELDPNDPDIQKSIALAQIQVDTAQKLANIKSAAIVRSHEVKDEITKDKAATDIAVTLAKAKAERTASASKPKQPTNQAR